MNGEENSPAEQKVKKKKLDTYRTKHLNYEFFLKRNYELYLKFEFIPFQKQ